MWKTQFLKLFCGPDPIRTGIMLPCKGSAVPLKPRAQKGLHCHRSDGSPQTLKCANKISWHQGVPNLPRTEADKSPQVTVTLTGSLLANLTLG